MQLPRKMSAQNMVASISSRLGNREHKPTGNEIRFAGEERKDKLYEPKHKQKLVRILTVVAYVIFVSMAAILLSLYYSFLWDPKDVSVRMRVKSECSNIILPNSLETSTVNGETQTEKMTADSVTVVNEQSELSETITTERQKDLLTILTKIANSSTSASPLTKSKSLKIDVTEETTETDV